MKIKFNISSWVLGLAMFLLFGAIAESQQLPLYSKYFMTRHLVNPARTGAYGYTTVDLTARQQWIGFDGAPQTHTISFQTRILKTSYMSRARSPRRGKGRSQGGRVGVGGTVFNDQSGLLNFSGAMGSYAYHINMQQAQLSFGLSLSFVQFKLNESDIVLYDQQDDLLESSSLTSYVPDATVGAYFTLPDFYAGVSATQLLQSSIRFGNSDLRNSKMIRHYYGLAGFNYRIDREWAIEPSLLIKTNEYLRSQFDLSVRGFYKQDYWAGLTYRTGGTRIENTSNAGAMVVMAGVSVDMFHFGYAFDYSLNNIKKYSWGSHEINVAIRFGDNARRYRWLDRY